MIVRLIHIISLPLIQGDDFSNTIQVTPQKIRVELKPGMHLCMVSPCVYVCANIMTYINVLAPPTEIRTYVI